MADILLPDALIEFARATHTSLQDTSLPASNFLSPLQYKQFLSKGKTVKAPGSDNITNDVLQTNPDQFVRLLLPVHVKMALLGVEPLALKGAATFPIRKTNCPVGSMAAFRSMGLKNQLIERHDYSLGTGLYALIHASLSCSANRRHQRERHRHFKCLN